MPGIQLIREKYDDLVGWYDSFCYTHIFTKKVKHNVHEVFSHTKFILQNPLLMKETLTRLKHKCTVVYTSTKWSRGAQK